MRKKYYSIDELLDTFNIKKTLKCKQLDEWLKADYQLEDYQLKILKEKRVALELEGNYWNEEELKIRIIAILFQFASIDEADKIKVFFERSLKATINKTTLSVKCDCLVATPLGLNTPKSPYFFLQEYKKGKGDKYDPEAQLLAAKLIASHLNEDKLPIYGGFVVGQYWNFTTLINNEYCVSRTYDSTQLSDLIQIVYILKHLKAIILKLRK